MKESTVTKSQLRAQTAALKQKISKLEKTAAFGAAAGKRKLSLEQLRLLIDASPDLFFLQDASLRCHLVNAAPAAFFGRPEAKIPGKTDAGLMTALPLSAVFKLSGRHYERQR